MIGLGNSMPGLGTDQTTSRGVTPTERHNKWIAKWGAKFHKANENDPKCNPDRDEETFYQLVTAAVAAVNKADHDTQDEVYTEAEKFVMKKVRRSAAKRATATRRRKKAARAKRTEKVADTVSGNKCLLGSRWVVVKDYFRKDFAHRISRMPGADKYILEVVVACESPAIVFVRIPVIEAADVPKYNINEPKWRTDKWGRKLAVLPAVWDWSKKTTGLVATAEFFAPEDVEAHKKRVGPKKCWHSGKRARYADAKGQSALPKRRPATETYEKVVGYEVKVKGGRKWWRFTGADAEAKAHAFAIEKGAGAKIRVAKETVKVEKKSRSQRVAANAKYIRRKASKK